MKDIDLYFETEIGRTHWDFYIIPSVSINHIKNERLGNYKFYGWTYIKLQWLCFTIGLAIKNKK